MSLDSPGPQPQAPLAPEDYYMVGGLLVFTAAYHLKRGYCCGAGCRHCPYEHINVPESATPQRPEPSDADTAPGAG